VPDNLRGSRPAIRAGSDRENRLLAVADVLAADAPGSGRLAPDGICLDAVYAVALGGDDGRTLFMCAAPPLGQSDPTREHRAALLSRTVEMPGR
jgi:hypothetical protein